MDFLYRFVCFNFALYVIDQRLDMIAMLGSALLHKRNVKGKQVKREVSGILSAGGCICTGGLYVAFEMLINFWRYTPAKAGRAKNFC